jgi:hypothetical protein
MNADLKELQTKLDSLQKMEFDVTTAEGPCRLTVVTGKILITRRAARCQ